MNGGNPWRAAGSTSSTSRAVKLQYARAPAPRSTEKLQAAALTPHRQGAGSRWWQKRGSAAQWRACSRGARSAAAPGAPVGAAAPGPASPACVPGLSAAAAAWHTSGGAARAGPAGKLSCGSSGSGRSCLLLLLQGASSRPISPNCPSKLTEQTAPRAALAARLQEHVLRHVVACPPLPAAALSKLLGNALNGCQLRPDVRHMGCCSCWGGASMAVVCSVHSQATIHRAGASQIKAEPIADQSCTVTVLRLNQWRAALDSRLQGRLVKARVRCPARPPHSSCP